MTGRRWRLLLLSLLSLALTGCDGSLEGVAIGARVPDFALPSLDGSKLDSASLSGKAVVLNFWATWCQPCHYEIPMLKQLAADERWQVIAIALDEEGDKAVRPFVESNDIRYTVLLGNQEIFHELGGFTIPYTLVLDGAWQVVNIYRGPTSRGQIERDLERIEKAI